MGISLILLALLPAITQEAKEATAGDAQKLVKIHSIKVEGSRFPAPSVTRLAQIKIGDEVNFVTLHQALNKVTATGLISKIDFEYESVADKETEVVLLMKCSDVSPSAQATIQIPQVDENEVWAWLRTIDPLFTRDLPPNESAIRLYASWITKYLEQHGNPKFQETQAIIADASSSSGNGATDRLSFKAVRRRAR